MINRDDVDNGFEYYNLNFKYKNMQNNKLDYTQILIHKKGLKNVLKVI